MEQNIYIYVNIFWNYILFSVINDFHKKERSYKRPKRKEKNEEIEKE